MKSAILLISHTRWNVYCSWGWSELLVSLLFLKSQKRSEKTVQTIHIEQENSGDYNQWFLLENKFSWIGVQKKSNVTHTKHFGEKSAKLSDLEEKKVPETPDFLGI
jgi:hypothetical protein